jgi:hypothetical protein
MFKRYLFASVAIVAAGLILHLSPLGDERIGDVTDIGHVLGFAALGYVLLRALSARRKPGPAAPPLSAYVLAGGLALGFGLIAEALQIPFHRDASWGDVARDGCGVAAALLAVYAGRLPRAARAAALLGAALIVVGGTFGPARRVAARISILRHFPVLADFDSPLDLVLIKTYSASISEVPAPPSWGVSGRVALVRTPGRTSYEAVAFQGLPPDWSAYTALTFRVATAQPESLRLLVSINDAARESRFPDRFLRRFKIDSTPRTIRIPLDDLRGGRDGKPMDLARIADVTFIVTRRAPSAFYIDRIALE